MNKSSITILLFLLIFSKNYSQFHKLPENIFSVKIKGSNQNYPVFNLSDNIKEDVIFGRRPETLGVDDFVHLTNIIANGNIST